MKDIPKNLINKDHVVASRSLEFVPGMTVVVKKVALKDGKQSNINDGQVFIGKLKNLPPVDGQLELVNDSGSDIFNTSNIKRIERRGNIVLIETETSTYEISAHATSVAVKVERGPEANLEKKYSINDVENLQSELRVFRDLYANKKSKSRLGESSFYSYLTTGSFTFRRVSAENVAMLKEEGAKKEEYEKIILTVFNEWLANIKANWEYVKKRNSTLAKHEAEIFSLNPNSLDELHDLYRRLPDFNDYAPASYQEGLGEEGQIPMAPFLHIYGHRISGYQFERPNTDYRIYVNPPQKFIPAFVSQFIQKVKIAGIPFYFKMIDFSLDNLASEDKMRTDRLLFYVGGKDFTETKKVIEEIASEHPDWFTDRPLPSMVARAPGVDGIGYGEDPSEEQNRIYGGKTSFSGIRAKLLKNVYKNVALDLLRVKTGTVDLKSGEDLSQVISKIFLVADPDLLRRATDSKFNEAVMSPEDQYKFDNALMDVIMDILPEMDSTLLHTIVQKHMSTEAVKLKISPNNLAFNIK